MADNPLLQPGVIAPRRNVLLDAWDAGKAALAEAWRGPQSPITGGPMYDTNAVPVPTSGAQGIGQVLGEYLDPAQRGVGVNTVLGFTESPAAIKLKSMGRPALVRDMWGDQSRTYNFGLVDNGEELGSLYVKRGVGAPDAMVNVWGAGENSLGPGRVREMLAALKQRFPDLEEIYGQRISGARKAAGDTTQTARLRLRPRAVSEPE